MRTCFFFEPQVGHFPLLEFVFLRLRSVIDVYKCASTAVMVGHKEWYSVV